MLCIEQQAGGTRGAVVGGIHFAREFLRAGHAAVGPLAERAGHRVIALVHVQQGLAGAVVAEHAFAGGGLAARNQAHGGRACQDLRIGFAYADGA